MEVRAKAPIKQIVMEAVIIRADGSQVDLGEIVNSRWKWYKPWTYSAKKASKRRIELANERAGI